MIKTLRNLSPLEPFFKWYDSQSRREQTLIDVGMVVVAFALVYSLLLNPAVDYRNSQVDSHREEQASFIWMQQHANDPAVNQSRGSQGAGNTKLSVVSNSAGVHNITLNRLQPTPTGINIEIRSAPFNVVVQWLLKLESNYGFKIVEARFERLAEGNAACQIRIQ